MYARAYWRLYVISECHCINENNNGNETLEQFFLLIVIPYDDFFSFLITETKKHEEKKPYWMTAFDAIHTAINRTSETIYHYCNNRVTTTRFLLCVCRYLYISMMNQLQYGCQKNRLHRGIKKDNVHSVWMIK